jgi:sugar phosphate permease
MVDPPALSSVIRKVILRLVPLMMLLYLVNYVDRANVAYAATKMNHDLGLTTAMFGLGAGIFYVGYMLFEIPSNILLHRVGARIWIARILITWGIVSGATAFIQGPTQFYLIRILLGVAEAGFYPGMILYLTYWLPRRNRVFATSLFVLAIPLSNVVAAPISLPLVAQDKIFGIAGWRFMFLVECLPAIILGIVTLFLLTSRPEQAKWLTDQEKQVLRTALDAEARDVTEARKHFPAAALRNPRVFGLSAVYFGINFGLVALIFFLPQILASFKKQYGANYSPFEIGLLTALPYLVAIVVMLFWGWNSRRTGEATWHVAIPMFVGGISTAAALYMSSPVTAIMSISVTAACVFSAIPVFWQLPSAFLTGTAAAAAIGLINTIGVSSNFVGPYLMGWLHDATGSFRPGMFVIAGFMVMAGVLALVLREVAVAAPTHHADQTALVTGGNTIALSTEES